MYEDCFSHVRDDEFIGIELATLRRTVMELSWRSQLHHHRCYTLSMSLLQLILRHQIFYLLELTVNML